MPPITSFCHLGTAVLFICADVMRNPAPDEGPLDRAVAAAALADLLAAAAAGGFTRAGVLETLLQAGEITERTVQMAAEALACAGPERVAAVCARHHL